MADEGISKIKQELSRKRAPPMGRVEELPQTRPTKQHVKSNFNLSFNNSFNTSIANGQKPTMNLRAES